MKTTLICTLSVLFCLPAFAQKQEAYKLTEDVIRQLQTGHFDSIVMQLDTSITNRLQAADLKRAWESLHEQLGEEHSFGDISIDSVTGFTSSYTPIQFPRGNLVLSIAINAHNRIGGLHFQPKVAYDPPAYVNTLTFYESRGNFGNQPYVLEGTLSIPMKGDKHPCIIIVGGSGPIDRDGTVGDNKPYKDIAWALASKGIAVFRYDKRTAAYGAMLAGEAYQGKFITLKEEYTEDFKFALGKLLKHPKINSSKIIVMGHSQGGELVPLLMDQNPKLAAGIMWAGGARSIQDAIIYQLQYLYDSVEIPDAQRKQIEATKRFAQYAKSPDLKPGYPQDSLPGATAEYWISLNKYDQVKMAKKVSKPLLILQGERDYQVTMTDFGIWKKELANKPAVTYRLYPALNHLFIPGQGRPGPDEYNRRGNIPEYVADDIRDWVKKLK